jgi:hypothetical protein
MDGWWTVTAGCTVVVCLDLTAVLMDRSPDPRAAVNVTAALLVPGIPAAAGDKGLTNSETFSGFQFNFNNPGARSLGMGDAFVAVADDATAVIANPAGLVILQRPELSGEVKFTRFSNTINAFSNTPAEGATNTLHSRDFDDSVVTPSFFSFVYPAERLVVAAFVRGSRSP